MVVRRDVDGAVAQSAMGSTSGQLLPDVWAATTEGWLITDTDDVKGAPMTAVMSYKTWQRDYAGDASVVGSTFWVNTKPVTVVGIAPQGFYGDRLMTTPPDFYLPIETMPVLMNVRYVHNPEENWLYIVGRVKPGVGLARCRIS